MVSRPLKAALVMFGGIALTLVVLLVATAFQLREP